MKGPFSSQPRATTAPQPAHPALCAHTLPWRWDSKPWHFKAFPPVPAGRWGKPGCWQLVPPPLRPMKRRAQPQLAPAASLRILFRAGDTEAWRPRLLQPLCSPGGAGHVGTAGLCAVEWTRPPLALPCSRLDSSFHMAAGPDVHPGLQKVLLERLLLCLCCRSPVRSHAWVTY